MTQEQVLDVLEFVRACYPTFEVTERRIDAWAVMLQDLPYQAVKRAVVAHAADSKFPPSIAEIRQRAAEYLYEPIPSVDAAYWEAREFAKHRYDPNVGPMTASQLAEAGLRPLTARALASVGVDVMALTDHPSVVAAQFKAAYQRVAESEIARRRLPQAALPGGHVQLPAMAWTGDDGDEAESDELEMAWE